MQLEELNMTETLTPKQVVFAMVYVETGNASEAYRTAYDVASTTTDNTINSQAWKLRKKPKIAQRILELQESMRKRHEVTIDGLTKELELARLKASESGQASAMVAATMGKAKLHGLLTDKKEITSPDETIKPTTIVLVGEPVPDYNELN